MGNFIAKERCPNCASMGKDTKGDNLNVWDDGVECFACGYRGKVDLEFEPSVSPKKSNEIINQIEYYDLPPRRLFKSTCEKYDIGVVKYTGMLGNELVRDQKVIAFTLQESGIKTKQKIRSLKDREKCIQLGNTKNTGLFGQHLFSPSVNRFLVVTEGEFDAASVFQSAGFEAVSITTGAGGAKKQLQANLDWLMQWKYVVLCFDSDEAGQKAVNECIELFEPGKVRVAHLPLKDANDMLVANREEELKKALWAAEEIKPSGIVSAEDVIDRVVIRREHGISFPWKGLTDITYGMSPNQIITLGGAEGVGKTECIKDIILHLCFKENVKVGLFSFEQAPEDTLQRLAGGLLGRPLHIPGEWWDEDAIRKAAMSFNNKLYLWEETELPSMQAISRKITYLVKAKGVRFVVIDHLKGIMSTMKNKIEETADAMAVFKSLAKRLGISLLLISHVAKDKIIEHAGKKESKGWREGRRPKSENLYGSSAITAWSDFVFGISRNANSENISEQMTTCLECLKSRLDGTKSGKKVYLYYNLDKGILEEMDESDLHREI